MITWVQRLEVPTPEAMHDLGVRLGHELRAGDVVVLTGELGAGKTTLTRGIGEGAGVRGPVTSPTFVLARTHPNLHGGPPLVHVDAYRLADADELDDLDLDWDGSAIIVEWGLGLVDPGQHWLNVTLERDSGADSAEAWDGDEPVEPRTVTIEAHGDRWNENFLAQSSMDESSMDESSMDESRLDESKDR